MEDFKKDFVEASNKALVEALVKVTSMEASMKTSVEVTKAYVGVTFM